MKTAGAMQDPRVDVLGVDVNVLSLRDAMTTIEHWICRRAHNYVCITSAHGVMESRRNEQLRGVLNQAGMVTADGMSLVWFSRLVRNAPVERVYGPDLMRAITSISPQRGYRHFYYGGPPGLAEKLKQAMEAANPGVTIVGTLSPPFCELTPLEDDALVARINAACPDIVWVGLSTPKQEFWMARHLGRIDAPVMIGVGAAFDFLAGTKRQAPSWMQRHGLEWLFRLATEPRRLWRRYAYIVPGFALLTARELAARAIRFGLPDADDIRQRQMPAAQMFGGDNLTDRFKADKVAIDGRCEHAAGSERLPSDRTPEEKNRGGILGETNHPRRLQ